MTRKYLIALLLFVSAASTALAQFTPVVSKVRQTQETLVGGKVVKSVQREALYYRQSDGSYIFKWVSQTKDGESLPESTGAFWDNKTASAYRLDYQNKRAVLEARHKLPMQPNTSIATIEMDKKFPEELVHGIPCRVHPLSIHMPSGNDVPAGQMCISRKNNLTLKKEETYSVGNDTFHLLMEYYDIQLGVEPDPKLFDFSHSFNVFEPATASKKD
jgi:hypothetical protein